MGRAEVVSGPGRGRKWVGEPVVKGGSVACSPCRGPTSGLRVQGPDVDPVCRWVEEGLWERPSFRGGAWARAVVTVAAELLAVKDCG